MNRWFQGKTFTYQGIEYTASRQPSGAYEITCGEELVAWGPSMREVFESALHSHDRILEALEDCDAAMDEEDDGWSRLIDAVESLNKDLADACPTCGAVEEWYHEPTGSPDGSQFTWFWIDERESGE
jgi:hypothetical protein